MPDPQLHELEDGSLVAYFDANGKMIDDEDQAVTARILKPDGSLIYATKTSAAKEAEDTDESTE